MAGPHDPGQGLEVEVNELAGPLPIVALRGRLPVQVGQSAQPRALKQG